MVWLSSSKRRKAICERVRKIRIRELGDGFGAPKKMARIMEIPYNTYRGYEAQKESDCRTNDEFLRKFALKWDVPLLWLLAESEVKEDDSSEKDHEIFIDLESDQIRSPHHTVLKMKDESMSSTVKKGVRVGIRTNFISDELNGKIVGIKKEGQILVRRVLTKGKTILAIADNPAFVKDTLIIHKSDILGEVVWSFQKF